MKKSNMIINLALIAALVAFAIVCILVVAIEDDKKEVINDVSVSVEKIPSVSSTETEVSETTEISEEKPEETQEQETEYSNPVNLGGMDSPDCDYDQSTNGNSVFETPFGDGYEFPDLSGYCFVFIGDSIFDMANNVASMPRQLERYTNAQVYNLSKNGSCAGNVSSGYISLTGEVECFVNKTETGDEGSKSFNNDIVRFANEDHAGKKMIIVVNQCINDYLFATVISNPENPNDINTYEGALRTNLARIKSAYPKATVVYMEPYVIGINDYGNEVNSNHYIMSDYVAALERVAGEMGVMRFDLRSYSTFAEYRDGYLSSDMLHPNKMCSKTMARLLVDFVQNNIR